MHITPVLPKMIYFVIFWTDQTLPLFLFKTIFLPQKNVMFMFRHGAYLKNTCNVFACLLTIVLDTIGLGVS